MGLDEAVSHLGWSGHEVWDRSKIGTVAFCFRLQMEERWSPLKPCNPDHFFLHVQPGHLCQGGFQELLKQQCMIRSIGLGIRCFQAKSTSPGLRAVAKLGACRRKVPAGHSLVEL